MQVKLSLNAASEQSKRCLLLALLTNSTFLPRLTNRPNPQAHKRPKNTPAVGDSFGGRPTMPRACLDLSQTASPGRSPSVRWDDHRCATCLSRYFRHAVHTAIPHVHGKKPSSLNPPFWMLPSFSTALSKSTSSPSSSGSRTPVGLLAESRALRKTNSSVDVPRKTMDSPALVVMYGSKGGQGDRESEIVKR
ncbi:hypothetical protein CPC08DRAFT_716548 [Agrocybe pediades]|nr:hypothetical protein CPC08DRAFT_716548 [Agrocybe pediades]